MSTYTVLSIAVIVVSSLPSGLYHVTVGIGSPSDTHFNATFWPIGAMAEDVFMCTMAAGPGDKKTTHEQRCNSLHHFVSDHPCCTNEWSPKEGGG